MTWKRFAVLGVAVLALLFEGCFLCNQTFRFRPTTAAQMRKNIGCRGKMLMIPIAIVNFPSSDKFVLDAPVEIEYPFDKLPVLKGYQYVVEGYSWDTGSKGLLTGFVLIGSDGSFYMMHHPEAPFDGDRDIKFLRARISPEWKDSLTSALTSDAAAETSGGWEIPGYSYCAVIFHWREFKKALPILRKFLSEHPLAVDAEAGKGKWETIKNTCFTPNVYCEKKLHSMPNFTEREVLMLRPVKVRNDKSDYDDIEMEFPGGRRAAHVEGMKREFDAAWATGKYRIVAYDRRSEKDLDDPERDHPWAGVLRTHAADRGIPLVILYGADDGAPDYSGLPKGVRQYWQCPGCVADQMK